MRFALTECTLRAAQSTLLFNFQTQKSLKIKELKASKIGPRLIRVCWTRWAQPFFVIEKFLTFPHKSFFAPIFWVRSTITQITKATSPCFSIPIKYSSTTASSFKLIFDWIIRQVITPTLWSSCEKHLRSSNPVYRETNLKKTIFWLKERITKKSNLRRRVHFNLYSWFPWKYGKSFIFDQKIHFRKSFLSLNFWREFL